jgi:hypothetical protein
LEFVSNITSVIKNLNEYLFYSAPIRIVILGFEGFSAQCSTEQHYLRKQRRFAVLAGYGFVTLVRYSSLNICPLGYISIHVLGLSLGTVILPPSPSYFRKQQQLLLDGPSSQQPNNLDPSAPRQNAKTVIELLSYSVVWWMLFAFVSLGMDVSRRMVRSACSTSRAQLPVKIPCADMIPRQTSHMSYGLQLTTRLSSLATFYSTWCSFPPERQGYGTRMILRANGSSSRKWDRKAAHPRYWRLSTRTHLPCFCWFVL